MSKSLFPVDPVMTSIAIAFRNKRLIADQVLPYVPVGKSSFKYMKYNETDAFTIPNTLVGRKSSPNLVEFGGKEETESCSDYFLDDLVPQSDIDDAPEGVNLINNAVIGIMDLILLDREKRCANTVFNANNYASSNKEALSGSDQFDDETGSDPIKTISEALDKVIVRPNVMVIGRKAFSVLARHPKICKAVHGNSGDSGIATKQQIAELFELEDIAVGEAFLNSAKKGQTMTLTRVWGNHIALICRDTPAVITNSKMTFGFTARFGNRLAGVMDDPKMGGRGSHLVRAGESVKEVVTSNKLGYLLQNVISA